MSLKVSVLESAPYHDMEMEDHDSPRYQPHVRSSLRRRRYSFSTLALAALAGFLLCYLLETTFQTTPTVRSSLSLLPAAQLFNLGNTGETLHNLVRPDNVTVIGLIFYGRPMFVNVLDCYLKQNLRVNGGWLDEVHFIANTAHEEDLDWLQNLVNTTSGYVKVDDVKGPWTELWTYLYRFDPETIFVKIDDDVVYMHEEAVPRLVTSLVNHPEVYAVGGHIVNQPHTHFWQYHTGALLPFLPDPEPLLEPSMTSWRPSELPYYSHDYPTPFDWQLHAEPQHNMTRWLPLPPLSTQNSTSFPSSSRSLEATPAWNATWASPRGGWSMWNYAEEIASWAQAAQAHYSFLSHLEEGPSTVLSVYNFLRDGQLWNQQWERYSVNFMAVRGGKLARQGLFLNDEVMITMAVSKEHGEPFLIDTGALVSHYSFDQQHEILKTDILARYYGYANEMVCGVNNQKSMITSNMTRTIH